MVLALTQAGAQIPTTATPTIMFSLSAEPGRWESLSHLAVVATVSDPGEVSGCVVRHLVALVGPMEDAEFWKQAAQVSRDYFTKSTHPVKPLNPCYANFDGSLVAQPSHYTTNFSYDAFRTAGNWAVD